MKIYAHRGASGYEPENTLSSFRRALELKPDFIELDVYALKTGELVVIHDDRVDRTTNGSGYVVDYDLASLQALDAGNGEHIPTLEEVVEVVDRQLAINVELKGIGTAGLVAELIERYVAKGWTHQDFLVSSFNHVELAAFGNLEPEVRLGALACGIPLGYAQFGRDLQAASVNLSAEFITPAFIADAHASGLEVHVYTVDSEPELARMLALGVDAVFSNYPDTSRAFFNAHQ